MARRSRRTTRTSKVVDKGTTMGMGGQYKSHPGKAQQSGSKHPSKVEKFGAPTKISPTKAPKIGTKGGPSKGGGKTPKK